MKLKFSSRVHSAVNCATLICHHRLLFMIYILLLFTHLLLIIDHLLFVYCFIYFSSTALNSKHKPYIAFAWLTHTWKLYKIFVSLLTIWSLTWKIFTKFWNQTLNNSAIVRRLFEDWLNNEDFQLETVDCLYKKVLWDKNGMTLGVHIEEIHLMKMT